MYTTVRGAPAAASRRPAGGAGRPAGSRFGRVSTVVLLLGVVSLITDLSSEMISAVLPVYLTVVLGLSPLQFGVVDGLYQGVSAAVRIAGGIGADLTRRPKLFAVLGYGLSAVCKLILLPASTFAAISSVVAIDRTGKGLRTAPRDAMIAESSDPATLGYSFGVHRAMDTAGALGGPLIAFGLLALLPSGYQALFVLSFALAAVGVAVLVLFVPDLRPQPAAGPSPGPGGTLAVRAALRQLAGLGKRREYRKVLVVAGLVSLLTISDGFVYLVLRDRAHLSAALFPLLYVGTSAAYLLLAVPIGRVADRVGRGRVFLVGNVLAVLGYLALLGLPAGPLLVAVVLGLVGSYYACTDGVLSALTSSLAPDGARTTALAGVQTVIALGNMISAIVFGSLWATVGPLAAAACYAGGLAVAVLACAWLLRGIRR